MKIIVNKKEFILAIAQKNGYEVWAKYDVDAEIYELFTARECECYIGAVDELKDARPFAIDWIAERESA